MLTADKRLKLAKGWLIVIRATPSRTAAVYHSHADSCQWEVVATTIPPWRTNTYCPYCAP
ncbi:hypothetical protein ACU4GD_30635 [Cupriavidus basilensis]